MVKLRWRPPLAASKASTRLAAMAAFAVFFFTAYVVDVMRRFFVVDPQERERAEQERREAEARTDEARTCRERRAACLDEVEALTRLARERQKTVAELAERIEIRRK